MMTIEFSQNAFQVVQLDLSSAFNLEIKQSTFHRHRMFCSAAEKSLSKTCSRHSDVVELPVTVCNMIGLAHVGYVNNAGSQVRKN